MQQKTKEALFVAFCLVLIAVVLLVVAFAPTHRTPTDYILNGTRHVLHTYKPF